MKDFFEKVSDVFVGFMALVGIIAILGVIASPIYMPIIISTVTKNDALSWVTFALCVAVAIALVVVLTLICKKKIDNEVTAKYNSKYHRGRTSQNSYLED